MYFLYQLVKSFLGYDRSTDYSDSLGLVDFAFALVNSESIILDHAFRTQLSNQPVLDDLALKSFKWWMVTVYGYSNSFFTSKKTHGPHRFGIYIIYYSFQFKNLSL